MKIPCKSIFLTLLLLAGMAGAHADPGQSRNARQQDQGQQQYDNERTLQAPERERNRANSNERASPRNNSRMTPEERSALRRQINEAGQDIYSGKYKR